MTRPRLGCLIKIKLKMGVLQAIKIEINAQDHCLQKKLESQSKMRKFLFIRIILRISLIIVPVYYNFYDLFYEFYINKALFMQNKIAFSLLLSTNKLYTRTSWKTWNVDEKET